MTQLYLQISNCKLTCVIPNCTCTNVELTCFIVAISYICDDI